jgi:hypothetical protein
VNGGPPPDIVSTVHPCVILRAPDAEARQRELARLVDDLRVMKRVLADASTEFDEEAEHGLA